LSEHLRRSFAVRSLKFLHGLPQVSSGMLGAAAFFAVSGA
jgi:hypothetical protein